MGVMYIFNLVNEYLKDNRYKLIIYLILIIVTAIGNIWTTFLSGKIIDGISLHKNIEIVIKLSLLFLAINIAFKVMGYYCQLIYIKIQTTSAFKLNKDLIIKIQTYPIQETDNIDSTYLTQRINSDSNELVSFIISLYSDVAKNLLTLIMAVSGIFILNIYIGFISVISLSLYIIFYMILKKRIYELSYQLKDKQALLFSAFFKQLSILKFIKRNVLYSFLLNKLILFFREYYNKVLDSQKFYYIYSSLYSIIGMFVNSSIFIVGGYFVIQGELSIGMFSIIMTLYSYSANSLTYFSELGKQYQEAKVSYLFIEDILKKKIKKQGENIVPKITKIDLRNVNFSRNERKILSDITIQFSQGHIYGITGGNGSGKTSLIDLILYLFNDEYQGDIYINDLNILDIDMEYLKRKKISILEQETILMEGTARENIFLTTDYNIDNLKTNIGDVESFIDKEKFLSKVINNNMTGLSGGEKQKIGILRLFSKNADVFILDEPTNALDMASKEYLIKFLMNIKNNNKIILIISHDNNLLECCDLLINLD